MEKKEVERFLHSLLQFVANFSDPTIQPDVTPLENIRLVKKYGFLEGVEPLKKKVQHLFWENLLGTASSFESALHSYAKIRIDLNGLKPVNDISGHAMGDLFLDRVANFIASDNLRTFCSDLGLKILLITRSGGDEFDLLLYSCQQSLDEKLAPSGINSESEEFETPLELLRQFIIVSVTEINFPEMDFHCQSIRNELGHYACELLAQAEKNTNRKFLFTPSVSVGYCTFWEALLEFSATVNFENFSPLKISQLLMGLVEDITDKMVMRGKEILREALWTSPDPEDRMQALMITRSQSDRKVAILKDRLRNLIKRLNCLVSASREIVCLRSAEEDCDFLKKLLEIESFVLEEMASLSSEIESLVAPRQELVYP